MRAELVIKSRSLGGSSDLTILAPLKKGLVPALDSITYKTRAKRLMQTLTGGRAAMHEYALFRPLSDSVERVAKIHSFRVMVLEPEDKILLAVTFDGTLDSYIRVLWQKVGSLLDIIFCNAEGYVVACENDYPAWARWVRGVQVETHFFFHTHGLTVEDVQYLRQEEALHRRAPAAANAAVQSVRHHVVLAEDAAWAAADSDFSGAMETIRQSLQSLAVLYQLTDMYLPGSADGRILQRAARDLLREFVPLVDDPDAPERVIQGIRQRFARQLDWLVPPDGTVPFREAPPLPVSTPPYDADDVQGGLLRSTGDASHGCLVLLAFDTPKAAADLLRRLKGKVTSDADITSKRRPGESAITVSITHEGLRAFGLGEEQLAWFPPEFREGMAARASMLGDFRVNHPRRWRLPLQNWRHPKGPVPIEMDAVHLIVQMRIHAPKANENDPSDEDHPLHQAICELVEQDKTSHRIHDGLRVLSVQAMRRYAMDKPDPANAQIAGLMTEHFGFADGLSNPVIDPQPAGHHYSNQVHLGEVLLGHPNEGDAWPDGPPSTAQQPNERLEWLRNGSFTVLRKLSQNVAALDAALDLAEKQTGLSRNVIRAKMMGRRANGRALIKTPPGRPNDFHYGDDAEGRRCPFHSHIRRSNPRERDVPAQAPEPLETPGRRRPRLVRRGMSYGPRYVRDAKPKSDDARRNADERGIYFIAHAASIAEQFELVQRWIAGGNSSGGFSGQSDPFMGVPDVGETRSFRFEHAGKAYTIALDSAPAPNAEPQPFVRLEWGLYLFTPSMAMLDRLIEAATKAGRPPPVWSVEQGEATIQRLGLLSGDEALQGWKAALEDADARDKFASASVWAAIREKHAGVLATPYGVLVAERALIMQVLSDRCGRFSVEDVAGIVPGDSYQRRMADSIGEIYLGLDDKPGSAYAAMAAPVNTAIGQITAEEAYDAVFVDTRAALQWFIKGESDYARVKDIPAQHGQRRWELNLDAREIFDAVLGRLCRRWFGLSDDPAHSVVQGSWRWDWNECQPPIYPVQFTAPSRFIFQPHPADEAQHFGRRYGEALTKALTAFIGPHRAAGTVPRGPVEASDEPGRPAWPGADEVLGPPARLAAAILAAVQASGLSGAAADDLAARGLAGTLMGLLPTVDGNLKLSLNEWLRDGSFWSLRAAWAEDGAEPDFAKAMRLLAPTLIDSMQLRPAAEIVWRTATHDGDRIGHVAVTRGDVVVLSLVSAAQQCLAEGVHDVSPVFGGRRTADGKHPVHACPGYHAAMGVLLGVMAALIDEPSSMRPSPAPLAFTLEGSADDPPAAVLDGPPRHASAVANRARQKHAAPIGRCPMHATSIAPPAAMPGAPRPPLAGSRLLAIGDSWLAYWPQGDIVDTLRERHQCIVESAARAGTTLAQLVDPAQPGGSQIAWLRQRLGRFTPAERDNLRAILISGGGDDLAHDPKTLASLVHPAGSGAGLLDESTVGPFIDQVLRQRLATVLHDVTVMCRETLGHAVPIVIHGYDHPVPDGRGILRQAWLAPPLEKRGYDTLGSRKAIMEQLIDRLNLMQIDLLRDPKFRHVAHADLRHTLSSGSDYEKHWQNELHPTIPAGFGRITERLAAFL